MNINNYLVFFFNLIYTFLLTQKACAPRDYLIALKKFIVTYHAVNIVPRL
jgi:hypothetical protein